MVNMRPWGPNLVLPLDFDADDGRRFTGNIVPGRLPLPFRYVEEDTGVGHQNAVVVGRILNVERRADGLWASGDMYDPDEFTGRHADMIRSAINHLAHKIGQVSADVIARPIRLAGRTAHTDGRLKGVTMVALPAFDGARVDLTPELVAARMEPDVALTFAAGPMQVIGETEEETYIPCCACDGTCPVDTEEFEVAEVPDFYPLESDAERLSCAVTGNMSLPVAEKGSAIDKNWDGGRAKQEIFRWASSGDGQVDPNKLAQAFLYRDPSKDPTTKWAWKLPIALPVAGELRIIPSAVHSASTIVNGGRAGVDIPESELATVRAKVERLYRRTGDKPPDDRTNPRVVERLSADPELYSVDATAEPPADFCSSCVGEADTLMDEEMVALNARLDSELDAAMSEMTETRDG